MDARPSRVPNTIARRMSPDLRHVNCPTCDALLATLELVFVETPIRGDGLYIGDDESDLRGDPELARTEANDRVIGGRIQVEPGFVNAKRRHHAGYPWYVRGRRPMKRSLQARLPLVITCRCGEEVLVSAPHGAAKWSQLSAEDRADAIIEEAGDRYIQQQVDLELGK
jgi:hypothetical protein